MQLRAQQGETLDLIINRHYGYTAGIPRSEIVPDPVIYPQAV